MPERSRKPTPELWEKLKPIARQMRREPTPAEDHFGSGCEIAGWA